jgi:hypothetical protein
MMPRHVVRIALVLCCAAQLVWGADDPLLHIRNRSITGSGVEYVWEIRQSYLAALPHCDPLAADIPVSPHQAAAVAREFLRARLPSFEPLGVDISLHATGIEKNPVAEELWMYDISFTYYPELPPAKRPLENVMVLMDGKVLVPVERPERPAK